MKKGFLLLLILLVAFLYLIEIPKVYAEPDKTITYDSSTNIITAIGGNESKPINFNDLWLADKDGELLLQDRDGIDDVDSSPVSFSQNLRPADEKGMGNNKDDLWIEVTNWSGDLELIEIRVIGTDLSGTVLIEDIPFIGNGIKYTGDVNPYKVWKNLTESEVISHMGTGTFDYEIIQGQWGIVWKTGDAQFMFEARIVLGNGTVEGTTWFADVEKQVTFSAIAVSGAWQNLIEIRNYGHLTLGALENEAEKRTWKGVQLIALDSYSQIRLIKVLAGGELNLYSATLNSQGSLHDIQSYGDTRIWNTLTTAWILFFPRSSTISYEVFNCIFLTDYTERSGSAFGVTAVPEDALFDRITVMKFIEIFSIFGINNGTFQNIYSRGCNRIGYLASGWNGTVNLLNVDSDVWGFVWSGSGSMGRVYRQYSFELNITDIDGSPIENANVTLTDLNGEKEFSVLTWANGSFPIQTVTYGFYNQTGGVTAYMKTPHNLTITHSSYPTLSYSIFIDEPVKARVCLETPAYAIGLGSGFIVAFILSMALLCVGAVAISRRRS